MRVIFTPAALDQLDELHYQVTFRSGFENRADHYIERIVSFCEGLSTFPNRGRNRDDLLAGLRTTAFEKRVLIAYHVSEGIILIEGIYYGGQDYGGNFNRS
jgi:toxin ParE1/3/4